MITKTYLRQFDLQKRKYPSEGTWRMRARVCVCFYSHFVYSDLSICTVLQLLVLENGLLTSLRNKK